MRAYVSVGKANNGVSLPPRATLLTSAGARLVGAARRLAFQNKISGDTPDAPAHGLRPYEPCPSWFVDTFRLLMGDSGRISVEARAFLGTQAGRAPTGLLGGLMGTLCWEARCEGDKPRDALPGGKRSSALRAPSLS